MIGESAKSRVLLFRIGQIGLVDRNGGAGLGDDGLLLLKRSHGVFNIGLRGRQVGLGLIEGRHIVAVIDLGERLGGFDRLIVFDQNLAQVSRHFGGDDGGIGLHISVIGRFQKTPDHPVIAPTRRRGGDRNERDRERQDQSPAAPMRYCLERQRLPECNRHQYVVAARQVTIVVEFHKACRV